MSFVASLLSAALLALPRLLPGVEFAGAAPFALAALPWLALAPLAPGAAAHLAPGLAVLGWAFGLELAAGGRAAALGPEALLFLLWGALLASGPRRARSGAALFLAATAALLFLTPATAPGRPEAGLLAALGRAHPLAVVHAWAAAGPAAGSPADLASVIRATGLVLLLALLVRAGGRGAPGEAESRP